MKTDRTLPISLWKQGDRRLGRHRGPHGRGVRRQNMYAYIYIYIYAHTYMYIYIYIYIIGLGIVN